jgi:hypothetical protein
MLQDELKLQRCGIPTFPFVADIAVEAGSLAILSVLGRMGAVLLPVG